LILYLPNLWGLGLLFIVYTTGRCNLGCRYCGGSFHPSIVPWRVEYSLDLLLDLVSDEDDLAFYGGEPLLNLEFIEEVIKEVDVSHYILQTNGILLHKLRPRALSELDAILVSIDGVEEITDLNRGAGVYRRVVENVSRIKSLGYDIDLIARMTVTEDSDIYRDVKHLLSLDLFDHIHWQLSLIWVDRSLWKDFWGWLERSYRPGLRRLMDEWIESLRSGSIAGIAPFQGILKRILYSGSIPPCGSGVDSFTILTNGRIVSCPIAVSEGWAYIGRLGDVNREDLKRYRPPIDEPCRSCSYLSICGCRCLYTHVERLWGSEGMEMICSASKYIIDLVKSRIDEILEITSPEKIIYPRYNNTVEIIP